MEERKRREKSNGCTLGFCNGSFEDSFCPKKNCLTQKVRLAVTLSKISTFFISSHFLYLKQNSLEQLRVTIRQSGSSSSRTHKKRFLSQLSISFQVDKKSAAIVWFRKKFLSMESLLIESIQISACDSVCGQEES